MIQPLLKYYGKPVPCIYSWGSSQRQCSGRYNHRRCREAFLQSRIRLATVNNIDLSILRLAPRTHAEAADLFYSGNVFYFEQYFTRMMVKPKHEWDPAWPRLPTHLQGIPPKYLKLIKRIGFAVTDESVPDHHFQQWQFLCTWINQNLPSLRHTYIFLFDPPPTSNANYQWTKVPARPSDRFLIRIIRYLDTIPGEKTIEYRGSNNSKRIVGNILAPHFRDRSDDLPTIRVIGGCYCACWTRRTPNSTCWTGPDTLWPWLRDWDHHKAKLAVEGSITPELRRSHKGPM
ncbi:MAG: hypothetical protein Q9224_005351, partial [Gallowayella concinna]